MELGSRARVEPLFISLVCVEETRPRRGASRSANRVPRDAFRIDAKDAIFSHELLHRGAAFTVLFELRPHARVSAGFWGDG